jgi:hypothetical protein
MSGATSRGCSLSGGPDTKFRILGHAIIAVTADLYSHMAPSMMEEATAAVAGLIFG